MNKTALFLALAVGLLLTAVVVGLPKTAEKPVAPVTVPTAVAPVPAQPPVPVVKVEPAQTPGSLSLTGKLSHPYIAVGANDVFVTLEVTGVHVPGAKRSPVNLALVIDRSGSMSGVKLRNANRAAHRLVELLEPTDQLAIVHYGNDANSLGSRLATDENKRVMNRYIDAIEEGGGTNIGEGLQVGRAALLRTKSDFRANRLLLLSDGQPTVGLTSNNALNNIVRTMKSEGISTTSLGVGADFNERLMQGFADLGGGSYGFAGTGDGQALLTTFEKDLSQAGTLIARGVTLDFPSQNGVIFHEVYGRPVTQENGRTRITLPDFSAGQSERIVIHLTKNTAVPGVDIIGHYELNYEDVLAEKRANTGMTLNAYVTNDRAVVTSKIDGNAYASGKKAQAQVNYEKAAEYASTGDTARAQVELKKNDVLFDDAMAVAGPAAVAPDREANNQAYGLMEAPAKPEERREQAKALKIQGLRSSGRGESVY